MKVSYPGLIKEDLPSGNVRYRVRVIGNPKQRIRIFACQAMKTSAANIRLPAMENSPCL